MPEPAAAKEWKSKGNRAFANGRIAEAVSCYSSGIAACSRNSDATAAEKNAASVVAAAATMLLATQAALLGNCALCYLKQENYQAAIEDCTAAMSLPLSAVDLKLLAKLWVPRTTAYFH